MLEENMWHMVLHVEDGHIKIRGNTEADCRAKALIYLIENNSLKVEDINNV